MNMNVSTSFGNKFYDYLTVVTNDDSTKSY